MRLIDADKLKEAILKDFDEDCRDAHEHLNDFSSFMLYTMTSGKTLSRVNNLIDKAETVEVKNVNNNRRKGVFVDCDLLREVSEYYECRELVTILNRVLLKTKHKHDIPFAPDYLCLETWYDLILETAIYIDESDGD